MKHILIIIFPIVLLSCGKEKLVQLPEIQNAKITEIKDVSPAYLFYNETKPDSIELNRKNLIITTNWLVNVDKRLTLKQALPSIIKIQNKKRNAKMHKNENARNYYTCHDTSIKKLGFIDFTDVVYDFDGGEIELENNYSIVVTNLNNIIIHALDGLDKETNITNFVNEFEKIVLKYEKKNSVSLSFNTKLSFQDYITFKSKFLELDLENTIINTKEYIFNF